MRREVGMALAELCKFCNKTTIPKRIKGKYVGSAESIFIWQCRECKNFLVFRFSNSDFFLITNNEFIEL